MHRLLHCLLIGPVILATYPCYAEVTESQRNEIVYRTNLGRADDITLLVSQGLSPDEKNGDGVPLLSLAAQRSDKEGLAVMKALAAAGANIDLTDSMAQTPLFYAAKKGNKEGVKFLLEQKANYYAVDKNGDVARTIAFQANHQDIVKMLDDYVKQESEKISQQYQDFNDKIRQQYIEQEALYKKQRELAELTAKEATAARLAAQAEAIAPTKPPAPAPTTQIPDPVAPTTPTTAVPTTPIPEKPPTTTPVPTAETIPPVAPVPPQEMTPVPPPPQAIPPAQDLELLEGWVRDLSYNSCAFEYWSFVQTNKQSSELSEEKIDAAIDMHREKMRSISKQIMVAYNVKNSYVEKVSDPSQKRLGDELGSMETKAFRRQNGVGKISDMDKRCTRISKQWEVTEAEEQSPAEETMPDNYGAGEVKRSRHTPQPRRPNNINRKPGGASGAPLLQVDR